MNTKRYWLRGLMIGFAIPVTWILVGTALIIIGYGKSEYHNTIFDLFAFPTWAFFFGIPITLLGVILPAAIGCCVYWFIGIIKDRKS